MEVNIWVILLATVAMFAIGAVWYTFIFGKVWSKIHSFYTLSEKKQKEMQKAMGPWYGVQLIVTIASAWVLAILIGLLPDQSPFAIAFLVWLGLLACSRLYYSFLDVYTRANNKVAAHLRQVRSELSGRVVFGYQ